MKFHNGETVSAEDVKFSLERYRGASAKPLKAELDPKRRETTLHRIQQLVHDKAMVAPIWLNAGLSGLGPRVEDSGIGRIAGFAWSGPYEDVKLKGK